MGGAFTFQRAESSRCVIFKLELKRVDPGWQLAANGPDGVSFKLQGDERTVSTYEWLHPFLQLYEAIHLQYSKTNIRFAVVELGTEIHIIHRGGPSTTVCSTTYEAGLAEISGFLDEIFRHLDATSGDNERQEVAPWLDSWLHELTLAEIHTAVTAQ